MATQVEPLLPGGAPLLQAEEHGGLVRKKPPPPPPAEGKGEPGANDVGGGEPDGGARRPRPLCAKPHKEGTGPPERESPRPPPPPPPGAEGLAVSDGEEGGGEPGAGGAAAAGRRDFVEAPPPKVNPWTKNALPPALAAVNGQSPPGGSACSPPGPGPLPGRRASPPPAALRARGSAAGRRDSGLFLSFLFHCLPFKLGRRAPSPGSLGKPPRRGPASGSPRPAPGPRRPAGNGAARAYPAGGRRARAAVRAPRPGEWVSGTVPGRTLPGKPPFPPARPPRPAPRSRPGSAAIGPML